jgi:tRNA(fMet)-specific endonuclease VapC
LIDTSVAIHVRDGDPAVNARLRSLDDTILLSIVSRVELEGGVYREPSQAAVRAARLRLMLETVPVLPFDDASADAYRDIVAAAGYSRRKILDRMIAAQAVAHKASVITMNGDDFRDVPGLVILQW